VATVVKTLANKTMAELESTKIVVMKNTCVEIHPANFAIQI